MSKRKNYYQSFKNELARQAKGLDIEIPSAAIIRKLHIEKQNIIKGEIAKGTRKGYGNVTRSLVSDYLKTTEQSEAGLYFGEFSREKELMKKYEYTRYTKMHAASEKRLREQGFTPRDTEGAYNYTQFSYFYNSDFERSSYKDKVQQIVSDQMYAMSKKQAVNLLNAFKSANADDPNAWFAGMSDKRAAEFIRKSPEITEELKEQISGDYHNMVNDYLNNPEYANMPEGERRKAARQHAHKVISEYYFGSK